MMFDIPRAFDEEAYNAMTPGSDSPEDSSALENICENTEQRDIQTVKVAWVSPSRQESSLSDKIGFAALLAAAAVADYYILTAAYFGVKAWIQYASTVQYNY